MNKYLFIFCLSYICVSIGMSQISPGELTSGHAKLEGMENCTTCHDVGKSLSNDKCRACHSEIDKRIKDGKGYHATLTGKLCEECHKEHHGRNFQIIRFDENTFDHSSTGFALNGKHATIECRKCHTVGKIRDPDILKLSADRKSRTYLGLSQRCTSCHEDKHKGQFKNELCSVCHTTDQWKLARKFSHDKTEYPLSGKHRHVECAKCHNTTLDDGVTIQYRNIQFASCANCHSDPHKGKFRQQCSTCHTTDDFHVVAQREFDHSETKFPLRGKHANLKCTTCHASSTHTRNASGEFGFHITRFHACMDCHTDAHAGQFARRKDHGKCESCHTEEGFLNVTFSIDQHRQTRFPLDGGHLAVPCASCHQSGKVQAKSTRQFHWEGTVSCMTCHQDIHKGQFTRVMTKGCETCHTTASWQSLVFNHDTTKFPLEGIHRKVPCEKCHTKPADSRLPVQYVGMKAECFSCHKDEHAGQFAVHSVTECQRCHSADGWKHLRFDHNKQSRFVLTGKHKEVRCVQCHKQERIKGRLTARYKPLGVACVDCHTDTQ